MSCNEEDCSTMMMTAMRKFPIIVLLCATSAWGVEYDFQTLNFPGSVLTTVEDINDNGTVVGWYVDENEFSHGFTWESGNFESPDLSPLEDVAFFGINNSGVIIGAALDLESFSGISFALQDGVVDEFQFPGSIFTFADGINNHDTIVGAFATLEFDFGSFRKVEDAFEELIFAGFTELTAYDINDQGVVVGSVFNANEELEGVIIKDGVYSTFNHPDGETELVALNDSGDMVGVRDAEQGSVFFVFDGVDFHDVSFPGALDTEVWGINNHGAIVGAYLGEGSDDYQGFIATVVPEPAGVWSALIFVVPCLHFASRFRKTA